MVSIDVCRLNGRPYVQATQMMARLCERIEVADAALVQAKFVRLTSHCVGVERAGDAGHHETSIGSVRLREGRQMGDYLLVELPDIAPDRERPVAVRARVLAHDGDLSGRCDVDTTPTFEGLLDALVQAIKSLHQSLAPPVRDIWFTGLRGFDLPVDAGGFEGHGRVDVTKIRVLSDGLRRQSLMNVSMTCAGLPRPCAGMVSFAFWTGAGNVD